MEDERVYTLWQHEREMTRLETQCKRWFIAFLIVLILFVGTNLTWVIYEMQYQTVTVTNEVDTGEGYAEVAGVGIGGINYGEDKTNNQSPSPEGNAGDEALPDM